ncbi:hypothetical protein [Pseudomonas syringae]
MGPSFRAVIEQATIRRRRLRVQGRMENLALRVTRHDSPAQAWRP